MVCGVYYKIYAIMGKSFMEEGQEYELAGFLNGWAGGVGV